MKARIYLPTRGRDRQRTLEAMPESIREHVVVCVNADKEERERGRRIALEFKTEMLVLPKSVDHIAKAWQAILDGEKGQFFIVDDDLGFMRRGKKRTNGDGFQLPTINGDDAHFLEAFESMEAIMDEHMVAMTGLSTRPFCWRTKTRTTDFTRHTQVYGYDAAKVKDVKAKFVGRWPLAQTDFHMQLQLIDAKFITRCLNTYCSDQAGSGAAGGASLYRSLDALATSAYWLQGRWPGIVTAVERETKTSFGGGKRIDVRVAWAKAAKIAAQRETAHRGMR
jgi:hypothetical protein